MFDLFHRRDKAVRYILTVLLGLVAISMVITLIPGYGTPRASSDNIVAEVGGDAITAQEVQSQMQGAVRNRQIPPEMLQFYVPQYIDQMVRDRALAYQAKRMGFDVTDAELATAIRSLLYNQFPNGQIDRAAYQQFLAQNNMTIEQFEANVRKNLLLLRLQNLALEGVVVGPQEVLKEFHGRNDKYKFDYILFEPAKSIGNITVSPQEVRQFFDKNRAQFKTPERRSFDLLIADEAKIGAAVQVSDADLQRAYSTNLDRYRTPERIRARHILVKTMDKPKEEQDKLAAKAGDLLKQLRGGANFADLAKKNSDDPGSAQKGGDLDWVVRGQTIKEFEDAAFALKPNELSNVVKTPYGYHIIQVYEKEPAKVKPFEEVKASLATELKKRTVYDQMQNGIEQARTEIAKDPKAAQQIADKYNLILVKADKVGPGESVPEVGTNAELQNNVRSLKLNEASQVFQLTPTRLGVAYLTAIDEPRQAEFAEVEKAVTAQMIASKRNQAIQESTKNATDKLRASNGNLQAAAKAIGAEIKTSEFLDAKGLVGGVAPVNGFTEILTKPAGATFGPMNVGGNVVMARLADKQIADEKALTTAERDSIQSALKRDKAAERRDLFEEGLVSTLTKEGKIKKYPEAIRRIGNSYKG
jgi:peptidyl-prolyl cis-trans isomerase D